jgi:hypothetical protein
MLEKCSNPDCDFPFDYREGRLIRFCPTDTKSPGQCRCVEHFWLCGKCSERYVLAYERGAGMKIRLRPAAVLQEILQARSKQGAPQGSTAVAREKKSGSNAEQVVTMNSPAVQDGSHGTIGARDSGWAFEAAIGEIDS